MKKKTLLTLLSSTTMLLSCLAVVSCGKRQGDNSSSRLISSASLSEASSSSGSYESETVPIVKDALTFHYHRIDGKYDGWTLWIWKYGKDGERFNSTSKDEYGLVFTIPLSTWYSSSPDARLGFIVSKADWTKDVDSDRYLDFNDLVKDEKGNYNIWLWTDTKTIYTEKPSSPFSLTEVSLLTSKSINVKSSGGNVVSYKLIKDEDNIMKSETLASPSSEFVINTEEDLDFTSLYYVEVVNEYGNSFRSKADMSSYFLSADFNNKYAYSGNDLGATYSKEHTSFKVWSPFVKSITMRLYNSGTPVSLDKEKGDDTHADYPMNKGENGIFSITVPGDLQGKYYTYLVTSSVYPEGKEIVDPYAKSAGINGLRGMIVDFSLTDPEGWDSFSKALPYDRKELTVYETHVADLTSSSTWGGKKENSKKFLGLCEEGTFYQEGEKKASTGFDHIKELGVNAVQLLPVFDQANDEVQPSFNWGYNPLNYNVLEGSYSSDPYNGYARIREFKSVVKAYHDQGINIIMDVVYNHVNSVTGQNFDVLAPGYYFRYNADGGLSNGSGCGNETASENYMFRKFMIDSTSFWAKEYKLGGFRFDLMGLHDLTTMNELTKELKKINPSICVYGEPWTGGSSPLSGEEAAVQANMAQYEGYGQFNDGMRDALIMSGMHGDAETGWAYQKKGINNALAIASGLIGQTRSGKTAYLDPDKTVNYVSCHDNYTIYDRLKAYEEANDVTYTEKEKEAISAVANAFVFLSNGTSFMLSGEEMLRTKGDDLSKAHNSYNSSYKVNELDYSRLLKYPDLMKTYTKLISLKKNSSGLHLSREEIKGSSLYTKAINYPNQSYFYDVNNANEFHFSFQNEANKKEYLVAITNGNTEKSTFAPVDFSSYSLYLDSLQRKDLVLSKSTELQPFEVVIGVKDIGKA